MPYICLLSYLLRGYLVQLRELGPPPVVLPPGYDVNARCEFHSGELGHSVENCKALKYKVQELIESKAITLALNGRNVNNNPMPQHKNPTVNMIEEVEGKKLVSKVDNLKTPLFDVKKKLLMNKLSPDCYAACECCLINPQTCKILRACIQELMNQRVMVAEHMSTIEEIETLEIPYEQGYPLEILYYLTPMKISVDPVTPLTITIPTPFPYENTKAVPWTYDSVVYIHGRKIEDEPLAFKDPIVNIVGTGGVTRSGIIFAPMSPTNENGGTSRKDKGKQIESNEQGNNSTQIETPVSEVEELMRIIKKSDYKVVEQLNQTLSKISMLSLLMCSKAHMDATVKFFRSNDVPQEILVCQFEGVVNNIASSISLGFNEGELPPERRNHKKALHISFECVDTILSRVLVDMGSSLNVLPKSSLSKVTIKRLVMKPNELIVRAFDGSRRTFIREVDFPIKIGPHTFSSPSMSWTST
ncbi:uncharacterized protein LOC127136926 [Lathyrus oleraceus]|uniref:uncharacterized protein LOC127136926 n=1 Tax=Pisum sativum TaxID=3888 RepID=UPI0021D1B0E4|nr:uncharacterized protein LOC127136926 [Pisum sativum]